MTQAQLNKLIALSEKERLEAITKVANKISKLVGKSFKDVSALLQYARLINDRSLDPLTKKKVEKLADELFDRVRVEITGGISGALKQSEKLSNHIESQITGVKPKLDVSGSDAALQSYLNKKQSDGFRFSKRIWKHNNLYKKKMNDAITDALKTGKSAKQLAKDLSGFVSPKAKGKGIYTDPRKNAERLARSEINMAYRRADSERWAKQWFVVGIKVSLSASHPKFDICFTNPFTKIFTSKGMMNIKDVKVGDFVLSHKGKMRKVKQVFRTPSKREAVTTVTANLKIKYDGDKNVLFKTTATDNHPFLINGEWKPIGEVKQGDIVKVAAHECERCGEVIPVYRRFCSKSCQAWNVATNQHKRPEHTKSLSDKRKKLIASHGGRQPWLEEYLKSGKNKLNLTRTPERIEKAKEGVAKMVQEGRHPFQQYENVCKANRALARNKYSTFIERKMKWLLEQKGIPYTHQYTFKREEKRLNGQHRTYSIDFVLNNHKIAIECDGSYWHKDKEKDAKRQSEIEANGFTVIRFTDKQIRNDLAGCSKEIDRVLNNHEGKYHFIDVEVDTVKKGFVHNKIKYNLEVEEDNSYVANGLVVHNCDHLDNRYPKDFVFVGWHPQCLCYATPILCSEIEQDRMNEYRLGLRPNPPKLRTVNKMPKEALQWVKMNKDRIAGWQTKPYWLQDNKRYFKEVLR